MTTKQKTKHHAAKFAVCKLVEGSSLDAAGPTPDGLGAWMGGGIAHRSIDGAKAKSQRTGDTKNRPGIDYPSKINETHQKEYNANSKNTNLSS
jgi:hypothetical protein